jgi:hypothetical protein
MSATERQEHKDSRPPRFERTAMVRFGIWWNDRKLREENTGPQPEAWRHAAKRLDIPRRLP